MVERLKALVDSAGFQQFIIAIILVAAVVVGLETSPEIRARHGGLLHALDGIILGIFVVEIALKMGAHGRHPWRYFRDPWNAFDFAIVAVCFLPAGEYAAVFRLVRILRVLRLVTNIPRLQLLVGALIKSIPSMGYVGILLGMLFYMYGVMGTFLFSKNDPIHFGSLPDSMISLFRTVTLEDWTDLMYRQMYGQDYVEGETWEVKLTPHAWLAVLYFVSFILIGTMVMLNLFIGVIMKSMSEMQIEAELAERQRHRQELGHVTISDELKRLEHQIDDLKSSLHTILHRVEHERLHDQAKGGEGSG